MSSRALLLLSGGIDSTTLLAYIVKEFEEYTGGDGRQVHCLLFDYGQTLFKEVLVARDNAYTYKATSTIISIPFHNWLPRSEGHSAIIKGYRNNALPMGRTVEEIRLGDDSPPSYVPFRNGILLAYAVAYGESLGVEDIYVGANGLESGNYWDDTAAFARAMTSAAQQGTHPDYKPEIHFPFSEISKSQIVEIGLSLGVDYSRTWSCYLGDTDHCGRCDSCVQRLAAFKSHGLNIGGLPTR
jgi:7-cyano-7-deazaguanine synthase